MNRLILIGILWCLAISTGRAQEAAKFIEASQTPTLEIEPPSSLPASEPTPVNGQPSPFRPARSEPPRRVAEPKRIVIQPGVDAQESEVAMQFMADLEKAGIAKIDKTEMTPTSDSPIVVQVFMREDESFEKIKLFLWDLRASGVEKLVLEFGALHPEGDADKQLNGFVFRATKGYSQDELQRLKKVVQAAAERCAVSLHFAGTDVFPSGSAFVESPVKPPGPSHASGFRPAVPQLRTDYNAANKQAHDLAESLRKAAGGRVENRHRTQMELQIEKSLAQKVALHFHKVELTEVIRHIATVHNINIVMKSRTIETERFLAKQFVSIDVDGITLRSALTLLLDQAGGLDYHIENEVLMITNSGEPKPAVDHDVDSINHMAAKKSELRTAVQRAFTLRQSLLRAELQEMQARLEKTQQSLDMRERIADQIVDRRVEDLLNPHLEWEGSSPATQAEESSRAERASTEVPRPSTPAAPIEPVVKVSDDTQLDQTQKSLLAKLQGFWDFQELSVENPEPRHFPNGPQMIYEIVKNRMASPAGHAYMPELYLRFPEHGSPQPIDLTPNPGGEWAPNSTFRCIIEVTDDLVRICRNNSSGERIERPTEFAITEDTDILELRRRPAPVTELEGDWHVVAYYDHEGKPQETLPSNRSFRGDQSSFVRPGYRHDCRIKVDPIKKTLWSYSKEEDGSFGQNYYELKGNQLILRNEPDAVGYQAFERGLVRIPSVVPPATSEQKLLWRSAIVEIAIYPSIVSPRSQDELVIGRGIVISSDGMILSQFPVSEDGDFSQTNIKAKFDDGSMIPLKLIEEAGQGWTVLQPEQPIDVNHFFEVSTTEAQLHDEVRVWAPDHSQAGSESLAPFANTVSALDRKYPALGIAVWQLRIGHRLVPGTPILDADGDLLGMTITGARDLLLAIPVAELKTMFPNSFGAAERKAE